VTREEKSVRDSPTQTTVATIDQACSMKDNTLAPHIWPLLFYTFLTAHFGPNRFECVDALLVCCHAGRGLGS